MKVPGILIVIFIRTPPKKKYILYLSTLFYEPFWIDTIQVYKITFELVHDNFKSCFSIKM